MSQYCNIQTFIFAISTQRKMKTMIVTVLQRMLLKRKGMKGISISKFATICSVLVYNHYFFYSEPPVSDEAVSRKPYPHVCIFQNSMPLQIFIFAVSNPSAHNVHHNCKNHNFCWWGLHSRSLEVNMFFVCRFGTRR